MHSVAAKQRWQRVRRARRKHNFARKMEAAAARNHARTALETQGYTTVDFDWLGTYNPRWARIRHFIIKRDHGECQSCSARACGAKFPLHCHHIVPRRYPGGTERADNLITLCPKCHKLVDVAIWDIIERQHSLRAMTPAKIQQLCQDVLLRVASARCSPYLDTIARLCHRDPGQSRTTVALY